MKCVFMSNRECKARPTTKNINSNDSFFNAYSDAINKCCGS